MLDEPVVIRRAEPADAEDIRRLAHAEGCPWSDTGFAENISNTYVLQHGKRILGVLCGTITPEAENVCWTAAHPMYPESSVNLALLHTLQGVAVRRSAGQQCRSQIKRPLLKRGWGTVSAYFKNRGVMHGVSGQ